MQLCLVYRVLRTRQLLVKLGRPALLSQQGLDGVQAEITNSTLKLQAIPPHKLREILVEAIAKERGYNRYSRSAVSISNSSVLNLRNKMKLRKVVAEVKSQARSEAYRNIRNSLSLCASIFSVNQVVDSKLLMSVDDVSIQLNSWDKPEVLTTPEAITELKEQNMSVSVTDQQRKRRVVTFNITIAYNSLICKIVKLKDISFRTHQSALVPRVFKMSADLFVVLAHPDLDDRVYYHHIYQLCIVPTAVAYRDRLIALQQTDLATAELQLPTQSAALPAMLPVTVEDHMEDGPEDTHNEDNGAVDMLETDLPANVDLQLFEDLLTGGGTDNEDDEPAASSSSSTHTTLALQAQMHDEERYEHICIGQDGAQGQIHAILEHLDAWCRDQKYKVTFLKYAAGCSMTQSPNDVGRMHQLLKEGIKSYKYSAAVDIDPPGKMWEQLRALLHGSLEPQSFDTFWHCLQHADTMLESAFSAKNIHSAYRDSGIVPFNPEVIMAKCPHFRTLSNDDAAAVLDCIGPLSVVCGQVGYVPEEDFETIMAGGDVLDNGGGQRIGSHLNDLVTNRQRSMLINHPMYLRELQLRNQDEHLEGGEGEGEGGGGQRPMGGGKKQRRKFCANTGCRAVMPTGATDWLKCGTKGCGALKWCPKADCAADRATHRRSCHGIQ